jgi:hypothetical protein
MYQLAFLFEIVLYLFLNAFVSFNSFMMYIHFNLPKPRCIYQTAGDL